MKGFSLVELSIVLVILGLLTGGILAGQNLIHAADLRKISSDITRFQTAIYSFRDKYFAMPGDMTNATAFWGKDATYCNSASGTAAADGTCNGNGDGIIGTGGGTWQESVTFWEHLRLAGLIEGHYDGLYKSTAPLLAIGENLPALGNKTIGANATSGWPAGSMNVYASGTGPNYLQIGTVNNGTVNSNFLWGSGLYTEDVWNLDQKIDDGFPHTGRFFGVDASASGNGVPDIDCHNYSGHGLNTAGPADMEYRLDRGRTGGCAVYVPLGL